MTLDDLITALKNTGFEQPNILLFESGMAWLFDGDETVKHFTSLDEIKKWAEKNVATMTTLTDDTEER